MYWYFDSSWEKYIFERRMISNQQNIGNLVKLAKFNEQYNILLKCKYNLLMCICPFTYNHWIVAAKFIILLYETKPKKVYEKLQNHEAWKWWFLLIVL